MLVLFDVEWLGDNVQERRITQLSALRTDREMNIVDSFDRLIRQPEELWDSTCPAMTGYDAQLFIDASSEEEVVRDFASWIGKDDILYCWQSESRITLKTVLNRYGIAFSKTSAKLLFNRIADITEKEFNVRPGNPYAAAKLYGVSGEMTVHKAKDDVEILRRIVKASGLCENRIEFPSNHRERNAATVANSEYVYLFAPDSGVFHRRGCKYILGARTIMGCVDYEKAAGGRRPCKICAPEPVKKAPSVRAAYVRRPRQASGNCLSNVEMINGVAAEIDQNKLIGRCNSKAHPGYMTVCQMEQHNCLGRQCKFFERNAENQYWTWYDRDQTRKARLEAKAREKIKKPKPTRVNSEEDRLLFQALADKNGDRLRIVRVEREGEYIYRVFYVSENTFPDGKCFPDFFNAVKSAKPRCSIYLRHIVDVDGHFVTIDEYEARQKLLKRY